MKIQQYYLACLSHASYMITDEKTKKAAVVDPQRDIAQYLADAKAGGYTIEHVFLTHFHADFVAGHIELRDAVGATIRLGKRAEAELSSRRGDSMELPATQTMRAFCSCIAPLASAYTTPVARPRASWLMRITIDSGRSS